MEASGLVRFKHQLSHLRQESKLLIGNSNEIHGLGSKMIKSSQVDVSESSEHKVAEFFSILVVTIIDELHQEQIVKEELRLSMNHDILLSAASAVQVIFLTQSFRKGSGLCWELQSHE